MPVLTNDQIKDLITATRPKDAIGKINEIAARLTDYTVMNQFLKKEKMEIQHGDRIKGNLLVNHSFAARQVGLHQVIEPSIPDVLDQFEVPWRHTNWHWSWERREGLMNAGAEQIVDMLKARRAASVISAFEHLEDQFWNMPGSSDDRLDWYGVPYWVVKAAAPSTGGHDGGNPAGFPNGAGNLDSNKVTRWKNYNATYENYTEEDWLRVLRRMFRMTNFKSPVSLEEFKKGASRRRIFVNEETIDQAEVEARLRNDNHGGELAKYMGSTMFKRIPLEYVPKLDEDAQNPTYFLDTAYLCTVVLSGDFMHEHEPMNGTNQPNSWVVHTDLTSNVMCTNRRFQGVAHRIAA